jgi:chromosome segregation ATPase
MKDTVQVLEKKRSLLERVFGLKKKVEEEQDQRERKSEIASLEKEVKSVDEQILDAQIEEARPKVEQIAGEASALMSERDGISKRATEIDARPLTLPFPFSTKISD